MFFFFLHSVFVLIRTSVNLDFILSVPLNPSVLHVHSVSAVFALLAPHCATALLCYSGLAPVLLLAAIFIFCFVPYTILSLSAVIVLSVML